MPTWESVFEISHVRAQKLLDMSQHVTEIAVLAFPVGLLINKVAPELDETKPQWQIMAEIIAHLIILIISVYYVRKISLIVPFLFNYNDSYIVGRSSSDGENLIGPSVAYTFCMNATQTKLKAKIDYLQSLY
tara:strand:- start:2287 stop:2682 length:396 start_codon:yes stop_codon:yes gene_type:complete